MNNEQFFGRGAIYRVLLIFMNIKNIFGVVHEPFFNHGGHNLSRSIGKEGTENTENFFGFGTWDLGFRITSYKIVC